MGMTLAKLNRLKRTPQKDWSMQDCRDFDAYIKVTALARFEKKLKSLDLSAEVRTFMRTCVHAHYGSTDVDALLTHLECYPEMAYEDR